MIFSADRLAYTPVDVEISEGWIFGRYFNGKFFFNSEADWYYRTNRFIGAAPTYIESWRYMTEAGVLAGPARISLLYSFLPGPDRRAGILINKQPFVQQPEQANAIAFAQYSLLLSSNYGSGVNAWDLTGTGGYMSDAQVLAAKLDYSLASNLNLFASILNAKRASHGYSWGYITPTIVGAGPAATSTVTYANIARGAQYTGRFIRVGVRFRHIMEPAGRIQSDSSDRILGAGKMVQLCVHQQGCNRMDCSSSRQLLGNHAR